VGPQISPLRFASVEMTSLLLKEIHSSGENLELQVLPFSLMTLPTRKEPESRSVVSHISRKTSEMWGTQGSFAETEIKGRALRIFEK
jgi:hypothetical protein